METNPIVVAGATGDLGGRIVRALLDRGATVRALVRHGSAPEKTRALQQQGAETVEVDYASVASLAHACQGAACVVSALAGVRDVIVDTQTRLLDAAVEAGVPRFFPSDYATDFTRLVPGTNRNLDLRREFGERVDRAPIRATSVLNGAFMELLTGQAPIILKRFHRVLYWKNADQRLDFTTKDDVAAYIAAAALDPTTPRYLRIAGDALSARQLAEVVSEVTGESYRPLRGGSLRRLEKIIRVVRAAFPQPDNTYPPWQGMQYLHSMFSGKGVMEPSDNGRYPDIEWTSVRDLLAAHEARAVTR